MPTLVPTKYRAFISYSHRDSRWSRKIHRLLEGFRIDKDLVGRETELGAIPKSLRPIFRDREDFSAGQTLKTQTLGALDTSAALIVICSPASAKSHYVNEEIRLFKLRNPERPVVPVIVDGTPGDADYECFPPALRFELEADGTVSERRADVLAADVRHEADGLDLAIAKVAARLIGLSSDDVFRRAERERRRKARARNATVAILFMLALATTGSALYAWQQLKTNEAFLSATLKTATDIVNTAVAQAEKYNVPRKATHDLLGKAESLFVDMTHLGRPTPDLMHRKAWMLIEFARNYAILGDTARQRERAFEARRLLMQLVAEHPRQLNYLLDLSVAHNEVGNLLVVAGDSEGALNAYREAFTIRERLTTTDAANLTWQRHLSVTANKIGDLLVAQGRLTDALWQYRAVHAVRVKLSKADPNNSGWTRDLAVAHHKIGEVLTALGNHADALATFRDAQDLFRTLAAGARTNAGVQRDLAVAHHKVADALIALKRRSEARVLLLESLTIIAQIAKTDPYNTGWQRDLSVTYTKIGDLAVSQGHLPDALRAYLSALEIFTGLTGLDSHNTGWQRDFGVCHTKIGDVLLAQSEISTAQDHFHKSLAVFEILAQRDPANAEWQRDLAVAHERLGSIAEALSDTPAAIAHFERALASHENLVKHNPDNLQAADSMSLPLLRLGALRPEQRVEYFSRALQLLKRAKASGQYSAERQAMIEWLEQQLQ